MPRGKKESNRPPAGGIKRNDHHRRNRKRNISMHCHSHGYQTGIRVVRAADRLTFESLTLRQINERENAAFHGRDTEELVRTEEDEDGIVGRSTRSSLKLSRLLYSPPFLKHDEIRQRRFGGGLDMNDRWWEWEEEKGIKTKPSEDRFRWAI